MSDWSAEIEFVTRKLGMGAANAVRAIRSALDKDPFEIVAYRGYGNGVQAHVYGRVLERTGATASSDTDSVLTNLFNTYRRIESDPLRHAELRVGFAGATTAMSADSEGYFGGWLKSEAPSLKSEWHGYHIDLATQLPDGSKVNGSGEILIPPESARFGIISDIDDTVIQSHVANFIQAARAIILGNARTRLPFPGVAAFYRALRNGVSGNENNPIFYVSSSPWNIYDVIAEFMELQGIPKGPLLLRDWELSLGAFASAKHYEHKGVAIRNVMQLYPGMKFILIGDTSQHDPEIYHGIVAEFPERILSIYIRDVSLNAERSASVQSLADEVVASNSSLVLAQNTIGAARHAVENGWISRDSLPDISQERREDERTNT